MNTLHRVSIEFDQSDKNMILQNPNHIHSDRMTGMIEHSQDSILLITDLDHTLVGDDLATQTLNAQINRDRHRYQLIYATGRSLKSAHTLMQERNLLIPDYWVTGVGTEIYAQPPSTTQASLPKELNLDLQWANLIKENWQREAIASFVGARFPMLKIQEASEQNPWKISYRLISSDRDYIQSNTQSNTQSNLDIIKRLTSDLQRLNLESQIIFSSDIDVDILPTNANKGNAVRYLCRKLNIHSDRTLVCGDSGNDISMFQQSAYGVIVNNAQPELRSWFDANASDRHHFAKSSYANGILEALQHFSLLPN